MDDYTIGMIQFENSRLPALKTLAEEIEGERLAGWSAYFKKDYECELLQKEVRRLQALLDKAGIKSQKNIIERLEGICRRKGCQKSTKK